MSEELLTPTGERRAVRDQYRRELVQKILYVRIEFDEELLGTAAERDVHREFIASKAPDAASIEEEVAAIGVDTVEQKARSKFARIDGAPILWDYQVKGMFKEACSLMARVPSRLSSKLKAHRKIIDGLVFVTPREIGLVLPSGGGEGLCERPLRAQTAQGERVALAASETVPHTTAMEFQVELLDGRLAPVVEEWLHYGAWRGLGQWRNSGKGRFVAKILRVEKFGKEAPEPAAVDEEAKVA